MKPPDTQDPPQVAETDVEGPTRFIGLATLAGWAGVMVVIMGTLMAGHWVALPTPTRAERPEVAEALQGLMRRDRGDWLAAHVMYADCRCSQRIVDHLVESRRPDRLTEHVLLVGEDASMGERLTAQGYVVTQLTPERLLSEYHLRAAPMLLIADPTGTLRYAGGYTERKQGYQVRDLTILDELMAAGTALELPAFGCAVSQALQDLLDPLGVKYASTKATTP